MKVTHRKALTLAEVLISVALTAVLITAVATAVHGSFLTQSENTKIAATMQAARFAMHRIMRDVRTAAAIDYTAGPLALVIVPPDDGSGTQEIRYEHDPAADSLTHSKTVSGSTVTETLFGGNDEVSVTAFHAIYEIGQDWQELPCTKSVTIRLEFKVKNRTFAVTTSASPRRNQLY